MIDWLFGKKLAKEKLRIITEVREHYFNGKRAEAMRLAEERKKAKLMVISPPVQVILRSLNEDPEAWNDHSNKGSVFLEKSFSGTGESIGAYRTDSGGWARHKGAGDEKKEVFHYRGGVGLYRTYDNSSEGAYSHIDLTSYESSLVWEAMQKVQAYHLSKGILNYDDTEKGKKYRKVIEDLLVKHTEEAAGYLTDPDVGTIASKVLE